MALVLRSVLVAPHAPAVWTPTYLREQILGFLASQDAGAPGDYHYAIILDTKHGEQFVLLGDGADGHYGMNGVIEYPIGLQRSDVQLMIDEAIAGLAQGPTTIDWQGLPESVQQSIHQEVVQTTRDALPTDSIVQEIVDGERAELNIDPSDVSGQAAQVVAKQLEGSISVEQAQYDVVAYGKERIDESMDDLLQAAATTATRASFAQIAGSYTGATAAMLNGLADGQVILIGADVTSIQEAVNAL